MTLILRPLFFSEKLRSNPISGSNAAHALLLTRFPALESQTRDFEFFTIENERDYFTRYFKNGDVM